MRQLPYWNGWVTSGLLAVLLELHAKGVLRFNELYKTIPSISEKMLSAVLRSLVTDGLVTRKIYPTVPPKTEYCVSEFGATPDSPFDTAERMGRGKLRNDHGEQEEKQVLNDFVQGAGTIRPAPAAASPPVSFPLLSVRPILRNVLFLPHSVESAPNTLFIPDKTLSL